MEKRLYRDDANKKVAGVCAGVAEYLNVDVSLVRALFLIALILKGGGGIIYIILWIVLPKKPYHIGHQQQPQQPYTAYTPPYNEPYVDYTVPPVTPPFAQADYNVPPVPQPLKKGPSNGGLIAGVVLVMIGAFVLLDELDIIPEWDFEHLWPIILIAVGAVLVFLGFKHKDPQFPGSPIENSTNDNPPTE